MRRRWLSILLAFVLAFTVTVAGGTVEVNADYETQETEEDDSSDSSDVEDGATTTSDTSSEDTSGSTETSDSTGDSGSTDEGGSTDTTDGNTEDTGTTDDTTTDGDSTDNDSSTGNDTTDNTNSGSDTTDGGTTDDGSTDNSQTNGTTDDSSTNDDPVADGSDSTEPGDADSTGDGSGDDATGTEDGTEDPNDTEGDTDEEETNGEDEDTEFTTTLEPVTVDGYTVSVSGEYAEGATLSVTVDSASLDETTALTAIYGGDTVSEIAAAYEDGDYSDVLYASALAHISVAVLDADRNKIELTGSVTVKITSAAGFSFSGSEKIAVLHYAAADEGDESAQTLEKIYLGTPSDSLSFTWGGEYDYYLVTTANTYTAKENETEEKSAQFEPTASTEDGAYTVTLASYDNAGIPETATLSISCSDETTSEDAVISAVYAGSIDDIEAVIATAEEYDLEVEEPYADSIARLTVSLTDEDGSEVELSSNVTVTITAENGISVGDDEELAFLRVSGTDNVTVIYYGESVDYVPFNTDTLGDFEFTATSDGDWEDVEIPEFDPSAETSDGLYAITLSDYADAGIPDDAGLSLDYSGTATDENAVLEAVYGSDRLAEIAELIEEAREAAAEDEDDNIDDEENGEKVSIVEPYAESVARLEVELTADGEDVSLEDSVTVTLSWQNAIELDKDESFVIVSVTGTDSVAVLYQGDADNSVLSAQEYSFSAYSLADYDLMIVSEGEWEASEEELPEFVNTTIVEYNDVEYLVTVTDYEDAGDLSGAYVYAYAFDADEDAALAAIQDVDEDAENFEATVFIHAEILDADGNNMALESDVTAVVTRVDGEPIATLEEGETFYTFQVTEETVTTSSSDSEDGIATASADTETTTTTKNVYTITDTETTENNTTGIYKYKFTISAASVDDDLVTTAPGDDEPGNKNDENTGGGGTTTTQELNITYYLSSSLVLWDMNSSTQTGDGTGMYVSSVTLNGTSVTWAESSSVDTSTSSWGAGTALSTYFPYTADETYYDGDDDLTDGGGDGTDTVTLTITPVDGYYVTSVVIACAPTSGGQDNVTQLTPYSCTTWSDGEATTSTFSDVTGSSVSLEVSNLSFAHTSESGYYFILITCAKIPTPLYVEYSYGEIVNYLIEAGCDTDAFSTATGWTTASSENVYTYSSNDGTDGDVQTENVQFKYTYDSTNSSADSTNWKHYANSITDSAVSAAAEAGYIFVGWEVTYYTGMGTVSAVSSTGKYEDDRTVSGDDDGTYYGYGGDSGSSSFGYNVVDDSYGYPFDSSTKYGTTFVGAGDEVTLTTHCYIKAIWIKPDTTGNLIIGKTVSGNAADPGSGTHYKFTIVYGDSDTLSGSYDVSYTGTTETCSSDTTYHPSAVSFSSGSETIYLASGETATIEGLPVGATFTVTETEPDKTYYSRTTVTVSTNTGESTTGDSSGSTSGGSDENESELTATSDDNANDESDDSSTDSSNTLAGSGSIPAPTTKITSDMVSVTVTGINYDSSTGLYESYEYDYSIKESYLSALTTSITFAFYNYFEIAVPTGLSSDLWWYLSILMLAGIGASAFGLLTLRRRYGLRA